MAKKQSIKDTLADLAKEFRHAIYFVLNKVGIGLSDILNRLVYELYNLTEEEINIVEGV